MFKGYVFATLAALSTFFLGTVVGYRFVLDSQDQHLAKMRASRIKRREYLRERLIQPDLKFRQCTAPNVHVQHYYTLKAEEVVCTGRDKRAVKFTR